MHPHRLSAHCPPQTHKPHAHRWSPSHCLPHHLLRNRTRALVGERWEGQGRHLPGPVSPACWPSPAPCPGFTLRCGRLHLGSQPAGPPLPLTSHPLQQAGPGGVVRYSPHPSSVWSPPEKRGAALRSSWAVESVRTDRADPALSAQVPQWSLCMSPVHLAARTLAWA